MFHGSAKRRDGQRHPGEPWASSRFVDPPIMVRGNDVKRTDSRHHAAWAGETALTARRSGRSIVERRGDSRDHVSWFDESRPRARAARNGIDRILSIAISTAHPAWFAFPADLEYCRGMERSALWARLAQPFDVLIIGGGVTGCGAARDAACRGLGVALVEQGDVASGTSSRSSKLVHGGLRYLENAEFSLVFEAVTERRILQHIAPHLVNPQGFLFPVYPRSRHSPFVVNVGMWLYDGLSLFRSPRMHRNLTREEALEEEP